MNKYLGENYCRIEKIKKEKIKELKQKVAKDNLYYPSYHIAPPYGLLNDPNGLAYFNGEYHIFYQWCPNGPFHGMKSWHHLSTKDFINYIDHGTPLSAQEDYDNFGIYSGGSYINGDKLHLLYTGNARDCNKNYKRMPYQCEAIMNKNLEIESRKVFLKPNFEEHTEHFRDPVKFKEDIIIGAQKTNGKAGFAIYNLKSKETQYLKNNLETKDAYMYECPNLFELNKKEILIYSPQGLQVKKGSRNIYDVYYSIDKIGSIAKREWISSWAKRLDYGFDFYAPQIFKDKNRTLMIAWLGQAGIDYPLDEKLGWSQMLTMPRILFEKDNCLYQKPILEIDELKSEEQFVSEFVKLQSRAFNFKITSKKFNVKIGNDAFYIELSYENKNLKLNRTNSQHLISEEYGTVRELILEEEVCDLNAYIDNSALEIFINQGKYTMTSRFLIEDLGQLKVSSGNTIKLSYMNKIEIKEK